jgi:DNA-binding transcriptional LysR family regulator
MMMELRHIRYFLAVAHERHFTRAAARVGIGQPPLSQQIKDLETEIGTPLFHRLAHGAELTAAGEAFLEGVREMPAIAVRAATAAQQASRGETGSLRVGFTTSAAFNPVVPAAIRAFRRAYADVGLTLEETITTRLVAGLQGESFDAVFLQPHAAGSEAFQVRLLSEEPLLVALPVGHPVTAQQEVDLATLCEETFLLFPRPFGPTLYDSIVGACRAAGFEPVIGVADRVDRNSRSCGTRRVDRAGIDEPTAHCGRNLQTNRRASADGSARPGLSTRRNVACRAKLHRKSDVMMPNPSGEGISRKCG